MLTTSLDMRFKLNLQLYECSKAATGNVIVANGKRIGADGGRSSASQETQRKNKQKKAGEAAERKHGKMKVGDYEKE